MAYTMHSHSGQFCGHAVDTLEEVVQKAIAVGFETLGMSEHMPRVHVEDLYPEEKKTDEEASLAGLTSTYAAYVQEAVRLRKAYADQIKILVGFETEWIRSDDDDGLRIRQLAAHPEIDYFMGSVHHVGTVPIDYDKAEYARAIAEAAETETKTDDPEHALYLRYFDQQWDMLRALRPRVVGHFDLIRLLSEDPARDLRTWPLVWAKIERNLQFVANYGGWLECNTAALRKGLAEPYPARPIAEAWLALGGKFALCDDSHGRAHLATNYRRGIAYLESLGVQEVWTLARTPVKETEADANNSNNNEKKTTPTKTGTVKEKRVTLADFSASLRLDKP